MMTAEQIAHVETLVDNFRQTLVAQITEMEVYLQSGDLHQFENKLSEQAGDLYNEVAQTMIEAVAQSPDMEHKARTLAQKKGWGLSAKLR